MRKTIAGITVLSVVLFIIVSLVRSEGMGKKADEKSKEIKTIVVTNDKAELRIGPGMDYKIISQDVRAGE